MVRLLSIQLTVITCLLTAGCTPFALLNGASSSKHYTSETDVSYGELPRQKLDVYKPITSAGSSPLVIFFYGGGWTKGDKANYEFVAAEFTKSGITVVVPDYRLFPDVRYPLFVEDGAKSVAWAMDNAASIGADGRRVYVMGHSAGAYIAAMIALEKSYLVPYLHDPLELAGFIGLSGPYDFLPIEEGYLRDVFPQESRDASQPINHVTADAPPTLLIHGTDDVTVRPANSASLAQRLRDNDVRVELKRYEGVGHARVVVALAPPLDFLADTMEDSIAFIRQSYDCCMPSADD